MLYTMWPSLSSSRILSNKEKKPSDFTARSAAGTSVTFPGERICFYNFAANCSIGLKLTLQPNVPHVSMITYVDLPGLGLAS